MEDRACVLRQMKICRFCLSENVELTGIHEKYVSEADSKFVPLPLQIMACIAIEVFRNDGMPQLICNTCRTLTVQAYNFKTNCKKADDALRLFLATGQLSKPHIVNRINAPSTESSLPKLERNHADEEDSRFHEKDDSAEQFEIDEYEEGTQGEYEEASHQGQYEEGTQGEDEIEYDSVEEDSTNKTSEVNQVKTDCYPCPICERSFPLKQLLDLHLANHTRERSFECTECGRKFFTKYDLQKHITTHNPVNAHTCIVCKKTFSRDSLLRRHEKIHVDVPKYVCSHCDRTFLTKEYLDYHMERHNKKRPFSCKVCHKSFVFKQGLERHEVVHSNNKPYKCNYCEASFTSAIKLTRHITSHAGLRPYPCKLCRRTFLLSHHLTRHMRSHYAAQSTSSDDGIGPHKCDICSMAFRRKDSLINHSAIHSMVNLKCVICNTTFETADMVKQHITTHLTSLPFPCEKCDYSFETAEQLEEHELKHAEMEYEEQIEKEVFSEAARKQGSNERTVHSEEEEEEREEYDEEREVIEYTITDINNPEVVPLRSHQEAEEENDYNFLKNDISSDMDEAHRSETQAATDESAEEAEEEEEEVQEVIKPIVRQEGTKVYQRKPSDKKPQPQVLPDIRMSSLKEATPQQDVRIETTYGNLSAQTLNSLQNKQVKLGEKTVRVQKFIVTKEEMKALAKQGILEMKGGQVVLKNAGQPFLNATLKPIQKTDIDSLLDKKSSGKLPIKRYQKKPLENAASTENTPVNE